eukprot:1135242-Prorocentrum_minimum.AAC.4
MAGPLSAALQPQAVVDCAAHFYANNYEMSAVLEFILKWCTDVPDDTSAVSTAHERKEWATLSRVRVRRTGRVPAVSERYPFGDSDSDMWKSTVNQDDLRLASELNLQGLASNDSNKDTGLCPHPLRTGSTSGSSWAGSCGGRSSSSTAHGPTSASTSPRPPPSPGRPKWARCETKNKVVGAFPENVELPWRRRLDWISVCPT